ncbi:uncharacterized protein LOC116199491 [Punica granatum]|uniref:Uncharacterized protein LOC116199491 n=1 Tax=Punica granatum TaxID=22663 RepID=A0A6P8CW39_PUNGR|nr:uncharacterized protein LOC116199491 [Punica granatum]
MEFADFFFSFSFFCFCSHCAWPSRFTRSYGGSIELLGCGPISPGFFCSFIGSAGSRSRAIAVAEGRQSEQGVIREGKGSVKESRDMFFLLKSSFLKGDDGFRMNEEIVSLGYIMGSWPLVYSMLLLPTGRSSKRSIPAWPFLVLSFPGGGLGLFGYAALANADVWKEFYQYFRESRLASKRSLIHVTCLDFAVRICTFWIYNDMTSRKWYDKGFWLSRSQWFPF